MSFCKKCGTKLDDDATFCSECGTKLKQNENSEFNMGKKNKSRMKSHEEHGEKHDKFPWIPIFVGGVIILIIILVVAVANRSTLLCKYVTKYTTKIGTETYTSSASNCDDLSGCSCLHKSWLGLGACDSCECTRTTSSQVPHEELVCPWD